MRGKMELIECTCHWLLIIYSLKTGSESSSSSSSDSDSDIEKEENLASVIFMQVCEKARVNNSHIWLWNLCIIDVC